MQEFTLTISTVTLVNANPRKEMDGDETVDAIDLDIAMKGGPELLNLIVEEPDLLKTALWDEPRTHLEIYALHTLKFDYRFENHRAIIHTTRNKKVVLTPATIKKFSVELGEAGDPSILRFQIQGRPDEIEIGKLCHLQQRVVEVEISPNQQQLPLGDREE